MQYTFLIHMSWENLRLGGVHAIWTTDTSVDTIDIAYTVDIPRYWHDRAGIM